MSFDERVLQDIKEKIGIVELVSRTVKLVRRGNNYFGLCPFHSEKTPSFSVNPNKQSFTCFGCGASGDIIDFVKMSQSCTFQESVQHLASIAGVQLDNFSSTNNKLSNEIKSINNYLINIYKLALFSDLGKDARKYLKNRCQDEKLWEIFSLGFCSDADNTLFDKLVKHGFSLEAINASGVFNKRKSPMLKDRIVFPIFDSTNHCIGFGGRSMNPNDPAKYINSPETVLFKKRKTLYNANLAFKERATVIVTEGYFDVISMYGRGVKSVVAPLGTAISEDQLKMCLRYCDEPIIAFDGDQAGKRAAQRLIDTAMPIMSSNGKSFKFLLLHGKKDLDEIAQDQSVDIQKLFDSSIQMKDMLLERYSAYDKDSPEKRAFLFKTITDDLSKIKDKVLQAFYFDFLKLELFNKGTNKTPKSKKVHENVSEKVQKHLFALILRKPEILENIFEKFSTITYNIELRDRILSLYSEGTANIVEQLRNLGYNSTLDSILTGDVMLHTKFAESASVAEVVKEWESVYYQHYVAKREEELLAKALKSNFSEKNWELLKYIKENKCQ